MVDDFRLQKWKRKKIILYPSGFYAQIVLDVLLKRDFSVLEMWDNLQSGKQYRGVPVVVPHKCESHDTFVVYCGGNDHAEELIQQVSGFTNNICHAVDILKYLGLDQKEERALFFLLKQGEAYYWRKEHPDALVMQSVEIPITERCSLKCRDCANLMQYFENPKEADVEKTIADMDYLLTAVDKVEKFQLLGGEPFVSRNLYKYVKHFCDHPKILSVNILTNGTIIPTGENLECLKHKNVFVYISDYGELSRNLKNLVQLFEKEGIQYQVLEKSKWTSCAQIKKYGRTPEELEKTMYYCCVKINHVVKNGRFYLCPFLGNAFALHAIPNYEDESIVIQNYEPSELRNQLKKFLQKSYFHGCDYCEGREYNRLDIPAAIQTPTPLPYQRYDD